MILSFIHPYQIGGILFPVKGYNDGFFIGSISLIFLTLLYVAFICPESRVPSDIIAAEHSDRETSLVASPMINIRRLATKLLSALLLPISIFAPKRVPGTSRRNWNMTLCGLSLFFYVVSTVSTLLRDAYSDIQPFLGCLFSQILVCPTRVRVDNCSGSYPYLNQESTPIKTNLSLVITCRHCGSPGLSICSSSSQVGCPSKSLLSPLTHFACSPTSLLETQA